MPSESQKVDLIRIPTNELYATLEVLASRGVSAEGFDRIRKDRDFAKMVSMLLCGTTYEKRAERILGERMVNKNQACGVLDLSPYSNSKEIPWNELSLLTLPDDTFVFPIFPKEVIKLSWLLSLIANKLGSQTTMEGLSTINQWLSDRFESELAYYGWQAIEYLFRFDFYSPSSMKDFCGRISGICDSCCRSLKQEFRPAYFSEVIIADALFFLVHGKILHQEPTFFVLKGFSGNVVHEFATWQEVVVSVGWGSNNSYEIKILGEDDLDFKELKIAVPLARKWDKVSNR
jgi:hypothetical protein